MKKIGITTLRATSVFNSKVFHDVLLSINKSTKNFVHLKITDIRETSAKITFPPSNIEGISLYLTYEFYTNDIDQVKEKSFWQYSILANSKSFETNVSSLQKNNTVFGYFVFKNKIFEKTCFVTSPNLYYDANFSFSTLENKWLDLSAQKNDGFFSNNNFFYNAKDNTYYHRTDAFMAFKEITGVNGVILEIDAEKFADFTPLIAHHTEDKLKSGSDGKWINSTFTIANSSYRAGDFWIDGAKTKSEDFKRLAKMHIYSVRMPDNNIKISQTKIYRRGWNGSFKKVIVYKKISSAEIEKISQLLYNFSQ